MLIAMRNTVMSLLAVIVFSSFIQAQTITGKVLDKTGAGIPGVSVTVKGTGRGTSTNTEGSFSIDNIKQGAILQFSAAGFTPQDFTVAGNEPVTIILETAITGLNEVVVIGYGGTTRKKDVTGAIASVKAKDFNQGVIASPDQLLQSKVPGLEIVTNSGQPGAATTIKIRGNNSLRSGNSPLYVVDGVPLDGRTAKPGLNFGGGSGLDFGTTPESNPFLYINPYDIAQMDVLKDASAAAIYGSRGANGVVVITTNRGRSGEMRLDFGTRMGVTAGYMHKYKVFDAGGFRSALDKYGLNNSLDHGSDVDALKEVTQSALSQEYNLSLSGGNDNGKFRASFLGSRNNGFLKKTSLDKYLGNFSGEYKFLDKRLTIGFGLIAGHTTEHMGLISNTAGAGGNLISYALNWNPTAPLRNSNGLYTSATNSVPNPMAVIDGYNDVANVNVFLGNITSKVNIVKGLDYTFLYSINHGKGKRNTSIDGWVDGINGVSGIGVAALSDAALTSQIFQHMLNYNGNITENLKLEALVGYEYFKSNYTNSSVFGSQFNTNLDQATRIPILYTSFFQNAKTQTPLVTYVDPTTEIQSYFSRLKFGLLEKYFVDISVRADGSSKFGANNKYGYFPAVGAKWTISNEEFLKNSTTVSFLGLRASWGITGNQEFPSGASLEQFSSGSYNGIGQSNVANPDLKWEKTTQINVGLDYGLFNNKISGSIDYYDKNTTDILFQSTAIQPAPASIFFVNLPASLKNTGVEFSVNADVISKKNFTWNLSFNIAYNKNRLTKFNQANILTGSVSGQGVSGTFAQLFSNNQPANVFYLKQFDGFDQAGQQIIAENPTFQGDPNPHYLYGISTSLGFNRLTLDINMGGASGYLIYNNTFNSVTNISNLQNGKNVDASVVNTTENINSSVAVSSRYLESGNFFKLRNAKLNYAFRSIGKYVRNLNLFVGGSNLFVITKFTGFDPEVNVDKNNDGYPSRNMEYIPYPTPRVLYFGLNLSL